LNLVDPYGEDVSIRLVFKGDGWTEEGKAAVIEAVKEFWLNLDVGDVYVFDSAKMNQANQTLFFGGTAAITVHSSATGDAHSGFVPAGTYRRPGFSAEEQAQAIANVVNHEIFSHQFSFSDFSTNDRIAFDRKYQAGAPPEVRERYGTIVDGAAWTDPATRKRMIAGPMPVHSEDAKKAQRLRDRNLDPPSPGPNRWWKVW
jgi:hypothetical protein